MPIRVLAEDRLERWHTAHVPSRASRKTRARLARLLRVVLSATRVLQKFESLLRVVGATCSDLRTHGDGVYLVCGRSSEKREADHGTTRKERRTRGFVETPGLCLSAPVKTRQIASRGQR
jgi:hypothetical protein